MVIHERTRFVAYEPLLGDHLHLSIPDTLDRNDTLSRKRFCRIFLIEHRQRNNGLVRLLRTEEVNNDIYNDW